MVWFPSKNGQFSVKSAGNAANAIDLKIKSNSIILSGVSNVFLSGALFCGCAALRNRL